MLIGDVLGGHIELKAPGTGANVRHFSGHDRDQWQRFQRLPNILYTDGNQWALYRSGKRQGQTVTLSGDIETDGARAVTTRDAGALLRILTTFLRWEPQVPRRRDGSIDLQAFARLLAPLCRLLRDQVFDGLTAGSERLSSLANEWKDLLFRDADDAQFADSYAQTVTFALLLGRTEGADPLDPESAERVLAVEHALLSRALQVLTDPHVRDEIQPALDILVRQIGALPPGELSGPPERWLYFYEDFLAAYDPDLRRDYGIYYTPVEVVQAQVTLADKLLRTRLRKPLGFAENDVVTLDPAAGTGTYLLSIVEHALARVEQVEGPGAVPGRAGLLARNLYGFEKLVGPYAVAQLRLSRLLADHGAELPEKGVNVFLIDTLESPMAEPSMKGILYEPLARQHRRAVEVKRDVPVLVCIGNPPYDRHPAATEDRRSASGGWVRWGEEGSDEPPILDDFIQPAIAAGHGGDIKNLYNLYVYFWRWALWKVFEQPAARGPGIVTFISAASYLSGDAFVGMREHMRRLCDEIWIIDLGGEGRGPRREQNVFNIQTPVAIAVAARFGQPNPGQPARVHYCRIRGDRKEKLQALAEIRDFSSISWQPCPDDWHAPFRPIRSGRYFTWPLLTDLFPWQHSGVEAKRTWVSAPSADWLKDRWAVLMASSDRSALFRSSGDREATGRYPSSLLGGPPATPIAELPRNTPCPAVVRYGWRSFDRQYLIADARLIARPRPALWYVASGPQIYLGSLRTVPLGDGPTLTATALVPDRHHFRGSYGGRDQLPLYRDPDATNPNITTGLLDLLADAYGFQVSPEDFAAYVYGILAHPAFTETFWDELESCQIRVPLTKDPDLFAAVCDLGARLLWLHTYGERFQHAADEGGIPPGQAQCVEPVPTDADNYPDNFDYDDSRGGIAVGEGFFGPVSREIWEFEVSGLKVVQSWLGYRMRHPRGKKSSPLDEIGPDRWPPEFTSEFLLLLWVLEYTLAIYPKQAELLEAVVGSPCFDASELPTPSEAERRPPKVEDRGERRLDIGEAE